MRLRTDPVSPTERVASIAAATCVTVATALLLFAAALPGFVPVSAPVSALDAGRASEHLVYVMTRAPLPAVAPAPPTATPPPRPESGGAARSPAGERVPPPNRLGVASASGAGTPPVTTPPTTSDTGSLWAPRAVSPLLWPDATSASETTAGTAGSAGAAAGAPVAGVAVGFASRRPALMRFDSALRALRDNLAAGLASGRLKPPPLTQAERDVQLRTEALAVIAARGAGVPVPRATLAGGGVAIPLPFGGPSREQRERDRAIHAQTLEILARVQRRVDSVVAARRRWRADSLAHVEDSLRQDTRPQQ